MSPGPRDGLPSLPRVAPLNEMGMGDNGGEAGHRQQGHTSSSAATRPPEHRRETDDADTDKELPRCGCGIVLGEDDRGAVIFVARIRPGSPAALCGKLAIGDQVKSFSNPDPMRVLSLRHHPRVRSKSEARDRGVAVPLMRMANIHSRWCCHTFLAARKAPMLCRGFALVVGRHAFMGSCS